jgi:hypothetical protein
MVPSPSGRRRADGIDVFVRDNVLDIYWIMRACTYPDVMYMREFFLMYFRKNNCATHSLAAHYRLGMMFQAKQWPSVIAGHSAY